jgi:hypothetical protein
MMRGSDGLESEKVETAAWWERNLRRRWEDGQMTWWGSDDAG